MIVLELLHLKMEVTVSEPCDVIRVGKQNIGLMVFVSCVVTYSICTPGFVPS